MAAADRPSTPSTAKEDPVPSTPRRRTTDILFDLRTIIGVLFAVYGVVCLVIGLVSFTDADSDRAAGVNVNLWAGIGMLVLAALFIGWCLWRPVVPQAKPEGDAPEPPV
jgi:hypothetical protein